MPLWIFITILAYLLFAINGVADKFLLSKAVKHPIAYAFYIGITGPLALILLPFGFHWLTGINAFLALASGAAFTTALVFFYGAVQQTSISRILPIEGGLVPVFTLVFAYLFLGQMLNQTQLIGFICLVTGSILMGLKKEKGAWHLKALQKAVLASILFALSFTLAKYTYSHTNFITGLIWTRMGLFAAALSFLVIPKNRGYIHVVPKQTTRSNKWLFYGAHGTGALAGLLQNYAIALGNVVMINALQGVQFAFLVLLTSLVSKYYPNILKEKFTKAIVLQKIIAILLITTGLVLAI